MITLNSINETEEILKVDGYQDSIFEIVNETKDYISTNDCRILQIDICGLNLIDATKICILCSTYHFAKYPSGKIKWIVKDENVKHQISFLKLDNIEVEIKQVRRNYADFSENFVSYLSLCK